MIYAARRHSDRCPTHPGALLREDVIPATGRTKAEIARLLGISRQHRAQTGVSRGGGSARQIRIALHRSDETSDGLKRGAPVLIVDRGRPVARLEPVTRLGEGEQDGRLSRLIREGIVRPAREPLTSSLFTSQPPRPKDDASAVAALLAERRDSR